MGFSSELVLLNSKTTGKDRIYRTVQYGCKMIWYILWRSKTNKDYLDVLKRLEAAMSSTRKVLRLGKSHDFIESALRSIHIDDYFLRYTITGSNLNQACYLLMDNLSWLHSIGIIDLKDKAKPISEWSNKFWLLTSILCLSRDLYELINIYQNDDSLNKTRANKYVLNQSSGAYTSNLGARPNRRLSSSTLAIRLVNIIRIICFNKRNHPILLDTLKNSFDILLPLSSLDYIKLSPGMQGFCGLVSSIIGLIIVYDSKYKLTP